MDVNGCGIRVFVAAVCLLSCFFLLPSQVNSQTGFPPGLPPATLKIINLDISQYPVISCELVFRDYSGNILPLQDDLTIRIYEDEIPMTDFTVRSTRMIATVLLIDTSGSMRGKMEKVAKGVEAYLKRLGPDDKVMVMQFNSWRGETPVVVDFTSDTDLILNSIRRLKPRGQTALYDAIADGSERFFPFYRRAGKVVIVLSDGADNNSVREWFTAIEFAKEHNIKVFFVALGPEADRRMFSKIARETGGKVFTAPTEEALPAAYESVSKTVRTETTLLTYKTDPNVTADGRPHYVQVAVYKRGVKWVTSPLKSYKFRILKTASELAEEEKKAEEAEKQGAVGETKAKAKPEEGAKAKTKAKPEKAQKKQQEKSKEKKPEEKTK